jgi:hypothetical protein
MKMVILKNKYGGGCEIRTHESFNRLHTFQACALSRSANPPKLLVFYTLDDSIIASNCSSSIRVMSGLNLLM